MRLLITSALATGMLFFSVATASAVSFDFVNVVGATGAGGTANPGDVITADLQISTELNGVQAFFLQVNHGGGGSASAASIVPFLFLGNVGTPLGAPVPNSAAGGGATGQFVITVGAPNEFPPGQVGIFGSITFTAGTQNISIGLADAGGAVGGAGGVDLVAAGVVTFDTIPVPEPTTALLVGLGLVGLGVAGRRK